MSLSVVVGTFGSSRWLKLAEKALESVDRQTVAPASVHHVHASTLHEARNQGAQEADGDWLVFLDADDTLDSRFLEAMSKAIDRFNDSQGLFQPSHRNDRDRADGRAGQIVLKPPCDMSVANYLIIGTVVSKAMFERVGGFRDLPVLEDWDLWIRCFKAGAIHYGVPDAVYNITVRSNGRNSVDPRLSTSVMEQIQRTYFY
jgi:glycosyltransferase involved in cell wall biosynthesis